MVTSTDSIITATVLLQSAYQPDVALISAIFKSRLPGSPDPERISATPHSTELQIGESTCFISYEVEPFPADELAECYRKSWQFPQAEQVVGQHKAFVRLSMTSSEPPVKRHILFTHLVASVAQASDSLAVYWEGSQLLHSSGDFQSQSEDLSERNLLPQLWIDMRVEQTPADIIRFFSAGLRRFSLPELEMAGTGRSLDEVFEFGFQAIHFLLSQGEPFAAGSTVGRATDTDEKLPVEIRPSFRDPTQEVMSLSFG